MMKQVEILYQEWVKKADDPEIQASLASLSGDPIAKEQAFSGLLAFGTAGMRGVMGAGSQCLNIYTIRQVTAALARVIVQEDGQAAGVAISYDNRHNSRRFAKEAARVLAAKGIRTYVFEAPRPTPELSFAVRELKTFAGIMVTASHNPKQYNGYKCYGADGAQMIPEHMAQIDQFRQEIDPFKIEIAEENDSRIHWLDQDFDERYLAAIAPVNLRPKILEDTTLKLVYTPLQGTGRAVMQAAFARVGYTTYHLVEEQAEPEASFSQTPDPNPENQSAFALAEMYGQQIAADLLLATDPDADRLGAMIRTKAGNYRMLTGNEIAALLLYYRLNTLKEMGQLPTNGILLQSIVSGDLPKQLAQAYGLSYQETLTGFKWLADLIGQFEKKRAHQLLLAYEESYGYLMLPVVRDKDAIQAALALSEAAAYYQKQGLTLMMVLEEIFGTYGYYQERTLSILKEGSRGQTEIQLLLEHLRKDEVAKIAGIAVKGAYDYLLQTYSDYDKGQQLALELPKSNVLKYQLADQSWLALRPSGTEPKLKIYLGVKGQDMAEAKDKLDHLEKWARDLLNKEKGV